MIVIPSCPYQAIAVALSSNTSRVTKSPDVRFSASAPKRRRLPPTPRNLGDPARRQCGSGTCHWGVFATRQLQPFRRHRSRRVTRKKANLDAITHIARSPGTSDHAQVHMVAWVGLADQAYDRSGVRRVRNVDRRVQSIHRRARSGIEVQHHCAWINMDVPPPHNLRVGCKNDGDIELHRHRVDVANVILQSIVP